MKESLSADEIARLRRRIEADGEQRVADDFEIARQTLARALAGLPVHTGTISVVREKLKRR